jgi:threonine synthase
MWAWEHEPASLATGILDDETYDWLAIVRGMLLTGGWPVVASEHNVLEAWCAGRGEGIEASATGTAGLAGGMSLAQAGLLHPHDRVGVLFTGSRSMSRTIRVALSETCNAYSDMPASHRRSKGSAESAR